jgi:SOS response regulatory protein OraA/RecX
VIDKIVLRLLSIKSFSSFELKKKLTRRGFPLAEIDAVIEKYTSRGFINDKELAERRTQLYKNKGYGPRWIVGKLKTQGLRPTSYTREEQRQVIQKLLATATFAKKEKNNKIAALQRRGFELDTVFPLIKD